MMGLFRHESRINLLRRKLPIHWIFQESCIEEEIIAMQNLWCFNKRMFAKLLGTKSWGFLNQFTRVTSKKTKEGGCIHNIMSHTPLFLSKGQGFEIGNWDGM